MRFAPRSSRNTGRKLAVIRTMARREASFICQNCGATYGRWQGKCDACGEWNTIAEENAASARPQMPGRAPRKGRKFALEALAGVTSDAPRLASGLAEFDRVTGGGFVRLRAAPRRRSRYRQIDIADPGGGVPGPRQAARGLYFRRGSGRAGAAARRAAWPRGRAGRARRRDLD